MRTPCDARTARPRSLIACASNVSPARRILATDLAIAKNSSSPAVIQAEQPG